MMKGNDDHGVKDATLHVIMGNEKLVSKNMLEGRPPQAEFKAVETVDLTQLRVKPGSVLNYWMTVRDNREPSSQRFDTARQVIEVVDPVAPVTKTKLEEQQKNDREQLDPAPQKTPDDEPAADQDAQPTEDKTEKPASDSGQADQGRNAGATGNNGNNGPAGPDQGSANQNESNRQPQDGQTGGGPPQLTPEQLANFEKIKQALKAQGANPNPNPGKAGGTPDSTPNQPNPAADSKSPNTRDANGPDQANEKSGSNTGNRPKLNESESPSGSNPPAPRVNRNPADRTNEVQPGVREKSPWAMRNPETRESRLPRFPAPEVREPQSPSYQ